MAVLGVWGALAALAVLAAVVALVVYAQRLPRAYTVRRSQVVAGDAAQAMAWLQDFRQWPQWSPWLLHDADTVLTYEGEPAQVGSAYHWRSALIGEGRVRMTHITPGQTLQQELSFIKPFSSRAEVRFDLQATADGQCEVTWTMSAQLPWVMRPFCSMLERMIGQDFELGLARLAGCVHPAAEHPRLAFVGSTHREAQRVAHEPYTGSLAGLSEFMGGAYPRLEQAVGAHACGPALAVYHKLDPKTQTTQCSAALPVETAYAGPAPCIDVPAGRYFVVRLQGHYRFLPAAWHAAMGQVRMQKLKADSRRPALEVYVNDACSLPSNEWITELYVPIR